MSLVPTFGTRIKTKEIVVAQDMPEIRLRESDQADPAGRYRLRVQDDKLLFERKLTGVGDDWATWQEAMEVDSDGKVQFGGPVNP